jgi:hypothetical protein
MQAEKISGGTNRLLDTPVSVVISRGYMAQHIVENSGKNFVVRLDSGQAEAWNAALEALQMQQTGVARGLISWFCRQTREKQLEVLGVLVRPVSAGVALEAPEKHHQDRQSKRRNPPPQ